MNILAIKALINNIRKNIDMGIIISVVLGALLTVSVLINVMQGYRYKNLKLQYSNVGRNLEALKAEVEEKLEIERKLKKDIERIKTIRKNAKDIEELKERYIKIWNGLDDLE